MAAPAPLPARSRLAEGAAIVRAVAGRPDLWITAGRQLRVMTSPRWWERWPFLPLPDRAYLRFRRETAYGSDGLPVPAADVVGYLEWCRRVRAWGG
jgi:hypothetical protein